MKKLGIINAFVLVIKKDRLHSTINEMMNVYLEQLGETCWKNVVVVITHVDFNGEDHESQEEYDDYLKSVEDDIRMNLKKIVPAFEPNAVIAVSLK